MKCPGQDSRYWKEGAVYDVQCPECGRNVEFFKDESTRKCRHCGHRFVNPKMDFGCAAYCRYAAQCLGELSPELVNQRKELLKDRVAVEVKMHYRRDFKSISRAVRLARYAEEIVREERGDPAVVLAASYLHDIGLRELASGVSESGPGEGSVATQEGPQAPPAGNRPADSAGLATVRAILEKVGADQHLVEQVCDLIVQSTLPVDQEWDLNARILHDVVALLALEDELRGAGADASPPAPMPEREFITETGRAVAERLAA